MKPEVELFDSIEERIAADGLAALTEPERFYRAIYFLEGEVSNGGLHQYFWNCPADWPQEALAALRAVGANKMAAILDQAIDLFPGRCIPTDKKEKDRMMKSMLDDKKEEQLTRAFQDYPDNLRTLIENYVKAHDAEFRGPRTLLEMWRSKQKRGVSAAPRFVTREIDIVKEAERDRPYSSRSCPVCDYPSPDYREVCKKCGFPHGKFKAS